MLKRPGHPSTHGHNINPWTCGSRLHKHCDGFSGGHDTYLCGCCCHDGQRDPQSLTEEDRAWINRVLDRSVT